MNSVEQTNSQLPHQMAPVGSDLPPARAKSASTERSTSAAKRGNGMWKFQLQVQVRDNASRDPVWTSIASFPSASGRDAHADRYPRTVYRRINITNSGALEAA